MSKYADTSAIVQVIGNIFSTPSLLDNEDFHFYEEDFPEEFHRILFGSMYNLHQLGAEEITIGAIEDYLSSRPKQYGVYQQKQGTKYLTELKDKVQQSTFRYYYDRMKKMTLLRMYNEKCGMDLSWLYDPDNILNVKKKQAQEEWLDNTPLIDIADVIDRKIVDVRLKFAEDNEEESEQAGKGAFELLMRLKETPEVGYPLYGPLINAVTRGARLKKFYLRSAATGVGKTRAMVADSCAIACNELYDTKEGKWISNGTAEPVSFVTTEQELEEIQTMMMAFIADVDEEHILSGKYNEGEWERVTKAAEILQHSQLYVSELPDFSLQDIENCIKKDIRNHNVRYVFFDYIHTSMKILSEITSKTGVKGLREDNILFMMSIRLKDICNKYGIFLMSATQLNSDYVTAQQYDQNLLRGAKAIADKIDCGMIMLEVSQEDREALTEVVSKGGFEMPEIKISIYKNRRGRYKGILLWCKADRGTCRITPMFATNYQYALIDIKDLKINVEELTAESAF